jgi:hypothetical protein
MDMSRLCIDKLPPILQLITEIAGTDVCALIIKHHGGSRLVFSAEGLGEQHPLKGMVDDATEKALCHYLKGTVHIPVARSALVAARNREIWSDKQQGMTLKQLSYKYRVCERTIELALQRLRKDSD